MCIVAMPTLYLLIYTQWAQIHGGISGVINPLGERKERKNIRERKVLWYWKTTIKWMLTNVLSIWGIKWSTFININNFIMALIKCSVAVTPPEKQEFCKLNSRF